MDGKCCVAAAPCSTPAPSKDKAEAFHVLRTEAGAQGLGYVPVTGTASAKNLSKCSDNRRVKLGSTGAVCSTACSTAPVRMVADGNCTSDRRLACFMAPRSLRNRQLRVASVSGQTSRSVPRSLTMVDSCWRSPASDGGMGGNAVAHPYGWALRFLTPEQPEAA